MRLVFWGALPNMEGCFVLELSAEDVMLATTQVVLLIWLRVELSCHWWHFAYAAQHQCTDLDQETDGTVNFKVEHND
jgi:hypothetical protein